MESFTGKLRDELLNRELFLHMDELSYVVDRWRMDYNHYRPHISLGDLSPVEFAESCISSASPTAQLQEYNSAI